MEFVPYPNKEYEWKEYKPWKSPSVWLWVPQSSTHCYVPLTVPPLLFSIVCCFVKILGVQWSHWGGFQREGSQEHLRPALTLRLGTAHLSTAPLKLQTFQATITGRIRPSEQSLISVATMATIDWIFVYPRCFIYSISVSCHNNSVLQMNIVDEYTQVKITCPNPQLLSEGQDLNSWQSDSKDQIFNYTNIGREVANLPMDTKGRWPTSWFPVPTIWGPCSEGILQVHEARSKA